jgi:hypothetical protein
MFKASNSFVTAKGSMPLHHKTIDSTSTKCKADNQGELHVIKKIKTFHDLSKNAVKQKNKNESDRPMKKQKIPNLCKDDTPPGTQWDGDNYSCAYDPLFTILFNIWVAKPKKNGKRYSKSPINIYQHFMMDSKNI